MANPLYSPYLQYSPTFRWGGRDWTQADMNAFIKMIGGPGKYDKWARRHSVAAKTFDPVEGVVYSQIQPQITAIEEERKQRAAYYQNLMRNLTGFTTALMGQLGQISPAIGSAYSGAAKGIGAAGTGYGAVLNADTAANAAVGNQTLSTLDAPAGQQLQGGDAGGVLAGLAGWIPQTMLNQQGGAYAEAATHLPAQASTEAQINMKDILDQAMQEDKGFSSDILQLTQGIPGIRQQYQQQQQQIAYQQQTFALKKLDSERNWYLKQATLAMAAGDRKRSNAYLKLAQDRENRMNWAQQGMSPSGQTLPGYHRDPRTGEILPNGWRSNKQGVPVKVGSGGKPSTSSTVPGTPAYNANAVKAVGKARTGIDKSIKGMITENPKPPFNKVYPKWEDAYQQLWSAYKYLAVNTQTKKQLDQVIRAALKAAGIKP